jgi:DNA-binding response OmpR family regulator
VTLDKALQRIKDLEYERDCLRRELGLERDSRDLAPLKQRWKLSTGEAQIVLCLYRHFPMAVRYDTLFACLRHWGDSDGTPASVKVYACRIRKVVGRESIRTVFGIGYALTAEGRDLVRSTLAKGKAAA